MADIKSVSTRKQLRVFLQPGGANIQNGLIFSGLNGGQVQITGVSHPLVGGRDPITVFNPAKAGEYSIVGETISPPGFPEMSLEIYELLQGVPLPDVLGTCPINIYEIKGNCADLTDHLNGWKGGNVRVYSNFKPNNVDPGDRTSWGDDAPLSFKMDGPVLTQYSVGSLGFQTQGLTLTGAQYGNDVTYATSEVCGNCGTANDGTKLIYVALAASTTSPGAKPNVAYTLNGGATWLTSQVSSAAVAEDLNTIKVIGNYLVVTSKTGGGSSTSALHYATIGLTGAPGTWTKVVTGFVGGSGVNDVYVAAPNEIYMVGDAGYIYKSTDITAGVSVINAGATTANALSRVFGRQGVIYTGGASSTIIKSSNGGQTWAATTTAPTAGAVTYNAVEVLSDLICWIGTSTGKLFSTVNGGESWNEFTALAGVTAIDDVYFATPEVGYVSGTLAGAAYLFATFTGGVSWTNTQPRLVGLGTAAQYKRITAPDAGRETIQANNLAIAGILTASTTGVVSLGKAQII